MHTRTATTAALLLTAALTSCSTSSNDKADPAPSATTPPPATTTAAPTPSPTPTSYTLGQPYHWSNNTGAAGTTTVLSYKQPLLTDDPPGTSLGVPAGSTWGRVDIRVCQTSGPSIGVAQIPWSVAFTDGSRIEPTGLNGGDFPKPEFPQDGTVRAGGCARGGIMFPIPKGQRPVRVVYAPQSAPEPVEWTIPPK